MSMTTHNVTKLVQAVKADISDEYRAFGGDEEPGIQLTIASTDGNTWTYQTGDNSFAGSCYHYHYWGVAGVYKDSNCREIARDLIAQVRDQIDEQ